jgi:DNA-binding NarL/FixJ family response regulator
VAAAQARGPLSDENPDVLHAWECILSGRWPVLGHVETDGTRFIVAQKVGGSPLRGLTLRERRVMAGRASGLPLKSIACDLGISIGTVSEALRTGMGKLCISSAAELPLLFPDALSRPSTPLSTMPGADVVPRVPPPTGAVACDVSFDGDDYATLALKTPKWRTPRGLTEAERAVAFALLGGATKEQVARERGTSTRTVANQITSIFAKLGVTSRIDLAIRLRIEG